MGLIDAIVNKTHQGILGAKAIQPYIADKYNGLTSAIHNKFNNFIDNVKSIPTLINDVKNFSTFMNDLRNGMKYARNNGKPSDSYFEKVKKGYKLSKLDRTDPIFHQGLREYFNMPPELSPSNYSAPRKKRINSFLKLITKQRITPKDDLKQQQQKKE